MRLTKAVTHIPLTSMNAGKLAALDALAAEYMALCQVYVTHFCTIATPDGYADFVYPTALSDRWQRVAVQLAEYHRQQLANRKVNASVRLERREKGSWWLTLSVDETVQACKDLVGAIGGDIGCKNALTDSQGKQYGLFDDKLKRRHKAD